MKTQFNRMLEKFVPFLVVGISLVSVFALMILFSYLFIWGLIVGGVIWLATLIKQHFGRHASQNTIHSSHRQGRIIEHDRD